MTLDELTNYFRFQSTATEEFTPPDQYEYQTINEVKVTGFVRPDNFAALLDMLNAVGFIFEGYKDKTPIFIKPTNPDAL